MGAAAAGSQTKEHLVSVSMGSTEKTIPEIRNKCSDLKVDAEKEYRHTIQNMSASGGGRYTFELTTATAILGEKSVCAILCQ